MYPRKEVFQATSIAYGPSSDISEPLVGQDLQLSKRDIGRFKFSAMMLGLFITFFIQFSTLGASLLINTIWEEDVITKNKRNIAAFSILWSFFTSAMAIVILVFLENLISISFNASHRKPSEDIFDKLFFYMASRFIFGGLIGVCLAWTMTDVLLGLKAQILYSLLVSVVAIFWCRVTMGYINSNEMEKKSTQEPLLIV